MNFYFLQQLTWLAFVQWQYKKKSYILLVHQEDIGLGKMLHIKQNVRKYVGKWNFNVFNKQLVHF